MKTKILFSLFLTLILTSSLFLVNNVSAQDEYGNHLWEGAVFQYIDMIVFFDNVTYSEGENFTVSNYLWDDFNFIVNTRVNTTVIGDGGYVDGYQGIGIQIFDENLETIYASGTYPNPVILSDPEPFETIQWMTEYVELDLYQTINYINVTLWHNYEMTGNVTDYVLTESWEFNLKADNYTGDETEEEEEEREEQREEEIMFFDLYFFGFIVSLFICPLSIAGAIKMRNPKLLRVTVFSFILLVICFFMLLGIRPF